MLHIVSSLPPRDTYSLLAGKIYHVGFKNGDIQFPNDLSTTGLNALLKVELPSANLGNPMRTPALVVRNKGSNCQMYVTKPFGGSRPLRLNEIIKLSINDHICFGRPDNAFRVEYTPLVILPSLSLSEETTATLKNEITTLGGHLVKKWSPSVTHLVMDEVKLTELVVTTLLSAKPIVKPNYFTELLSAIECAELNKEKMPMQPLQFLNSNNYLPPVAVRVKENHSKMVEAWRFYPNTERRTLFAEKTFLFGTREHLKSMEPAITAGGGNVKLIRQANEEDIYAGRNIIVIENHPKAIDKAKGDSAQSRYIIGAYRGMLRRFVEDAEIGRAALYNSVTKFCNPQYEIRASNHAFARAIAKSERNE